MINYRSVSIKGAFNVGRARALWHNGVLKVFDMTGFVLAIAAEKPARNKGLLRAWDVKTEKGDIIMRGKCMTCGGKQWWRIMYIPEGELWRQTK